MTSPTIRIHPTDNVVIARRQLLPGTVLESEGIAVSALVPPGHKVSTRAMAVGEPVLRYGQVIGAATATIAPGQHVHVHNLAFSAFERSHEPGVDARPTAYVDSPATFDGIVRDEPWRKGRIATRNYIGILTSVNCSATVARGIADHFRGDALADFPNVDGVVALTHGMGCATAADGEDIPVDFAINPTFGGTDEAAGKTTFVDVLGLPGARDYAKYLLTDALADRGIHARPAVWDDPGVDWERAGVVVVRSPAGFSIWTTGSGTGWTRRRATTSTSA